MLLNLVTKEELKLFIFNDTRELQLLNIESIFSTFEVLKEFKSNDNKEWQL